MSSLENRTVTSIAARRSIMACFRQKQPVFLWGPPGIGKSDLIASIAQEIGGHMIDLRLSQMEPTDLRGIPFFNKEIEMMDWAPPVDLPNESFASKFPWVVLFLDELNSATPSIQAAAYQLILNRRIGKYRLPDNVVLVAAGNRESDKGVTFRMPSPLANRFVHIEMRVDHESWELWALGNKIHQDVIGYIGFAKQDLYDFNPRSSSRSFATPRSWSFVSNMLSDTTLSDSDLTDLISGAVGEGMAIKFMAHRKMAKDLPNPGDVLDGGAQELKTKEISAMYSLTVSLCYELNDYIQQNGGVPDKHWHTMFDNFIKFMMDNFTVELCIMGARTAIKTYKLPIDPIKLQNLDLFYAKYGNYISGALNGG